MCVCKGEIIKNLLPWLLKPPFFLDLQLTSWGGKLMNCSSESKDQQLWDEGRLGVSRFSLEWGKNLMSCPVWEQSDRSYLSFRGKVSPFIQCRPSQLIEWAITLETMIWSILQSNRCKCWNPSKKRKNFHKNTQNCVRLNIWAPCGAVKLTLKIKHHILHRMEEIFQGFPTMKATQSV